MSTPTPPHPDRRPRPVRRGLRARHDVEGGHVEADDEHAQRHHDQRDPPARDATTVDQIAAAAEVSPSTFFRYFATKEDLVLTDEYDPFMVAAMRGRPADEPFLTSGRIVLIDLVRRIEENDREEMLARMRLTASVPALRDRMADSSGPRQMLLDLMAQRAGVDSPTLAMRTAAAAVAAALVETALYWAESDGKEHLVACSTRPSRCCRTA